MTINFGNVIAVVSRFRHSEEDGLLQFEESPKATWGGDLARHRCGFHILFSSVSDIGPTFSFLKNYTISDCRYLEDPTSQAR